MKFIVNFANSSLESLFRSDFIRSKTNLKLYRSLIHPILTYGYETWALTARVLEILDCFERQNFKKDFWRNQGRRSIHVVRMDSGNLPLKLRKVEWTEKEDPEGPGQRTAKYIEFNDKIDGKR